MKILALCFLFFVFTVPVFGQTKGFECSEPYESQKQDGWKRHCIFKNEQWVFRVWIGASDGQNLDKLSVYALNLKTRDDIRLDADAALTHVTSAAKLRAQVIKTPEPALRWDLIDELLKRPGLPEGSSELIKKYRIAALEPSQAASTKP